MYDVAQPPERGGGGGGGAAACPLVALVPRTAPDAHAASVQTLTWFPHDTGMFASSCLGGVLKVGVAGRPRAQRPALAPRPPAAACVRSCGTRTGWWRCGR